MLATEDGYSISQHRNGIQIGLPQIFSTATTTMLPVVDRKESLTDYELLMILELVRSLMNKNTEVGQI